MTEKTREIPLGNGYYLINDPYCWWIEKEYISSKTGKPQRKNLTMYNISVENAFESLTDYHRKAFDTKSMKVLIKEIKSTRAMIEKMLSDVEISKRIAEAKKGR